MKMQPFLALLAAALALSAGDLVAQNCVYSRCEAYTAGGMVEGNNHCFDVNIVIHPHSSTQNCVWNGTDCIGDPCSADYDFYVDWDQTLLCTASCQLNPRVRMKFQLCGDLIAQTVGTPYFEGHGTISVVPCNCELLITAEPAGYVLPGSPCLGGWSKSKAMVCSNCTASFPP